MSKVSDEKLAIADRDFRALMRAIREDDHALVREFLLKYDLDRSAPNLALLIRYVARLDDDDHDTLE